ncbi:MAG: hypothetical protein MPJ24_06725 [Pirellulaceae bacterium]|nr:hypothetical protein [Pirellulaceae bacterium]
MADNENTASDVATEEPASKKKSFMKLVIAGGVIGIVVVVQLVIAFALIPSKDNLTQHIDGQLREGEPIKIVQTQLLEEDSQPTVEVDLGVFNFTAYQPNSKVNSHISFHIYGTVEEEHQINFTELLTRNERRFREQVIVTVRKSSPEELADPTLGLIKRKILDKTNRLLGKAMLKTIIFSDFSYTNQD